MVAQFKEWKITGAGPFYVTRAGIGNAGQWHTNRNGVARTFKTKDGAQRRADELNTCREG